MSFTIDALIIIVICFLIHLLLKVTKKLRELTQHREDLLRELRGFNKNSVIVKNLIEKHKVDMHQISNNFIKEINKSERAAKEISSSIHHAEKLLHDLSAHITKYSSELTKSSQDNLDLEVSNDLSKEEKVQRKYSSMFQAPQIEESDKSVENISDLLQKIATRKKNEFEEEEKIENILNNDNKVKKDDDWKS